MHFPYDLIRDADEKLSSNTRLEDKQVFKVKGIQVLLQMEFIVIFLLIVSYLSLLFRIVLNKKLIIGIVMSAVLILILIPSLIFGLKIRDKNDGRNFGAIVSNGYGCADIGREALYDGGTAVDAAIATLVCEGVVVAHSMGIGGGFVATIYKRFDAKVETVIARESAPAAAHKDMFIGETSVTGKCSFVA